jgi:hypothetical protein
MTDSSRKQERIKKRKSDQPMTEGNESPVAETMDIGNMSTNEELWDDQSDNLYDAYADQWRSELNTLEKGSLRLHNDEMIERVIEGRHEDENSHPETVPFTDETRINFVKEKFKDLLKEANTFELRTDSASRRKAMKSPSDGETLTTRRVRTARLKKEILKLRAHQLEAKERLEKLLTSQSTDVKSMKLLQSEIDKELDTEDDEQTRSSNLLRLDSWSTRPGPFSNTPSTPRALNPFKSPGPGLRTAPTEEGEVTESGGLPTTALVANLALKQLNSLSKEPLRAWIESTTQITGVMSGKAIQRWMSESVKETLRTMAEVDPTYNLWEEMTKEELVKLLEDNIVKPHGEDKHVKSWDEVFTGESLPLDPQNLTNAHIASAWAGPLKKIERFAEEMKRAEANKDTFRPVATILLTMVRDGRFVAGPNKPAWGQANPSRDPLKELRHTVYVTLRDRVCLPLSDPRRISTARGIVIAAIKEVVGITDEFQSLEKVFRELTSGRHSRPAEQEEPTRVDKRSRTDGAPKGDRVQCATCPNMHAGVCYYANGGQGATGGHRAAGGRPPNNTLGMQVNNQQRDKSIGVKLHESQSTVKTLRAIFRSDQVQESLRRVDLSALPDDQREQLRRLNSQAQTQPQAATNDWSRPKGKKDKKKARSHYEPPGGGGRR